MCGRYAASASTDDLVEELEIEADRTGEHARSQLVHAQEPAAGEPDHNMAPSKNARVVLSRPLRGPQAGGTSQGGTAEGRQDDADRPVRQLRLLTWGFVPSWSKDPKAGARMANARAETATTSPAFRKAAASRRCLVPADGWYEWQASPVAKDAKGKPRKQPFFTRRADGGVTTLAGLYDLWRDPERADDDPDAWLASFAVITTEADADLERIHDRQPLVLDPDQWAAWLDPATPPEEVEAMLATRRPGRFEAYPVTRAVGNTRNNGPELLRPLGADELEGVVDPMTGEIIGGAPAGG